MEENESKIGWRSASALAAIALVCSLASCSFDYGTIAEQGKVELPSARFVNFTHRVVTHSALSLELKAASALAYGSDKRTELLQVTFSEFDPDTGELISSGSAERAVYWADSQDAEFSGSVRLVSKREDAILVGEYLRWDGKLKRLVGRLDRTVTISRSDGSFVSGAGFKADSKRRSFSFSDSVEGTIIRKEEAAK